MGVRRLGRRLIVHHRASQSPADELGFSEALGLEISAITSPLEVTRMRSPRLARSR